MEIWASKHERKDGWRIHFHFDLESEPEVNLFAGEHGHVSIAVTIPGQTAIEDALAKASVFLIEEAS